MVSACRARAATGTENRAGKGDEDVASTRTPGGRSRFRVDAKRFRPSRRTRNRNLVALVLALLAAALGVGLQLAQSDAVYRSGPLQALESAAQDSVIRGRNPSAYGSSVGQDPRQLITIVAIDDKSLNELGIWRNWPRTYYADVVEQLLQAPPRVITFDVAFWDPTADDEALAAAFDDARSLRPATAIVIATAGSGIATPGQAGDMQFLQGPNLVPVLASAADIASANVVPDDRGAVRSMPLLTHLGDEQRPTLGLATVAKYLRRPTISVDRPDAHTIGFVGRQIPVDRLSQVRINYFGPPSSPDSPTSTFRVVSFVDVLRGNVDPAAWANRMVFVGMLGATGFADDYWTPVSDEGRKMAGVEIHANTAATLMSTQFLREPDITAQVALIVGLSLLIGLLAANLGVLVAALGAIAILAGHVVANLTVLDSQGLQLPLANPLAAGLLAFIAVTAYRVIVEQRHARALRGALASVIPASVAHEIARDPDRVRLGGERRTISVLFTDIKNFTTFSESVDPEVLARVITEYLSTMTAVVFKHGGTVDKFIGDAVMAFWNAPLDDPDHALHACESALEMQAELRRLSDKWETEGLPRQRMRIGINTGPASVGNMGTYQRFAYTALGDTVNLGARLEPLNNEYGTWICISQATLDAAGGRNRFQARFLDLVAVKGKKEPAPVYELIGPASDEVLAKRYAPILDAYDRAMVLYQAGDFPRAAELFAVAAAATNDGPDPPSALYVQRCQELAQTAPPADWQGVYVMKHK